MRVALTKARISFRHLTFIAAILIITVAGSTSFGSVIPSTEASSSQLTSSSAPTKRLFLPVVSKAPATTAPAMGIYLGAWVNGLPGNMAVLSSFQSMIKKNLAIVHWYQGWYGQDPFNQNAAQTVASQGSVPMITWESWDWDCQSRGTCPGGKGNQPEYSDANIASGRWDSYIRSYAQSVKNYGKPVLIRWGHEMNFPAASDDYPWTVGVNGNSAQDYVNAWRHIHDVFASVGATNVKWVWSPVIDWGQPTSLASVFPGDNYVDWAAIDGYNYGNVYGGTWGWFGDIFSRSYNELIQLSSKPIMIAETASVENGGSKAQWIVDAMQTQMPRNYPRIRAFVWFDQCYCGSNPVIDWTVNSSSTSLASYQQSAASSYYLSTWP